VVLEEMAPFAVPAAKRPTRGEIQPTAELISCFIAASSFAEKAQSNFTDTEHLLLAILDRAGKARAILETMHVDIESITSDLRNALYLFDN
jgi:ATP-dependent Clp protease ATP-binding subunit ClpA